VDRGTVTARTPACQLYPVRGAGVGSPALTSGSGSNGVHLTGAVKLILHQAR